MANKQRNKVIRKRKQRDLEAVLKDMKATAIAVGVHADAEVRDGTTMATIGAVNEFGATIEGEGKKGRYSFVIPERSFLRKTLRENRKTYQQNMRTMISSVARGKYDVKTGMGRLGRKVELDVKKTMVDLKSPPNKPSTIKKKNGADNPLIDTGRLHGSIRWDYAKPGQKGISNAN